MHKMEKLSVLAGKMQQFGDFTLKELDIALGDNVSVWDTDIRDHIVYLLNTGYLTRTEGVYSLNYGRRSSVI